MPKNDEQPIVMKDGAVKEPLLSHDSTQKKAETGRENASPATGHDPHELSDNRRSRDTAPSPREPGERVELDTEGLEREVLAAQTDAHHPVDSKETGKKVELDLGGLERRTSADRAPQEPAEKAELDLEGLERKVSLRRAVPRLPVSLKRPRWRLEVAVLVLIALLVGAFWFSHQYSKILKKEEKKGRDLAQFVPPREFSQPLSKIDSYHFYRLAPFFVPIPMEQMGRERFLKVTLNLAFRDEVPSDEIAKKILMIRSEITEMLLEKSLSDLQVGGGKMALKREIKDLLNARLARGTVQSVYFEEFVIL